jgi:hypothetical protein
MFVQPAARPLPVASQPPNRSLAVVAAVVWPVTLLLLFATHWHFWWLIFVPIVVTGAIRNQRRNRS